MSRLMGKPTICIGENKEADQLRGNRLKVKDVCSRIQLLNEPVRDKTNNLGFRPGPTLTSLYCHRSRLETGNFGFKKKRDCTIHVAKTKALIRFAVTAKLVCAFVFAYANCWFSHAQAQM